MNATPSQTIGPFFHIAMPPQPDARLVPTGDPEGVVLSGRVLDGAAEPVGDALVELWDGRRGARCPTDEDGRFTFVVSGAPSASPLAVRVLARGLLGALLSRCYLPGTSDEVLASLPDDRAATLRAQRAAGGGLAYDIRLHGEQETVFFAVR